MIGTIGAHDVQQLIGTQGANELSLFVAFGSYARDALSTERVRQGLRLVNGEKLVDLALRDYDRLSASWVRIPFRSMLVVDDSAGL